MLHTYVETIVDMAIVECEGSIVRTEEAFRLRQAVMSQADAEIVVLDLSEVRIIEGSGLCMLLFLRRWTQGRDIRLKLFNPTNLVKYRLERANATWQFDFATLEEMVALMTRSDKRYAAAANPHDFNERAMERS